MNEEWTTTHQLSNRVVPQFEEAFARHSGGERVVWDIGFQAFPDPSRPPMPGQPAAFIGVMVLYVEIAGAVLGENLVNTSLLQPNSLTPQIIDEIVRNLVESLLNERTEQLNSVQKSTPMMNGTRP